MSVQYPDGTLGPYRLESMIGLGKVAGVYRAVHLELGEVRAVKVLPRKERAVRRDRVGSFRREAALALGLSHPNIVRTIEHAEADGFTYLAMELLEGRPLSELLPAEGPPSLERAVRLLAQLAAALEYLHGRGLIHRDLNTRNLFVGPGDRLTLIDFGTALPFDATAAVNGNGDGSGVVQAKFRGDRNRRGRWPDGARKPPKKALLSADLYGIGMVAYELLTGQKPFRGQSQKVRNLGGAVPKRPRSPLAARPDLPPAVEAVLLRQLGKDLAKQYRAGPFVAELAQALGVSADVAGGHAADVAGGQETGRPALSHA